MRSDNERIAMLVMGWQMKAPHVCMEQLLDGKIKV